MKRRSFIKFVATLPFVTAGQRLWAAITEVKNRPAKLPPAVRREWRATEHPLVFFAIGDWGAGGSFQRRVATAMQTWAAAHTPRLPSKPQMIVSTGDNIYPDGVESATDPQWQSKFERVYTGADIQVPWWAVLGNHDYRKNPDAQVAYGGKNARWNMPARYWSRKFAVAPETNLFVCALDTQIMLTRGVGWKKQIEWLDAELSAAAGCRWKVVVGHHPMRSYGHYGDQAWMLSSVKPLLEKHGVQLYLCGHDHDLQVIRNPADSFTCVVSGGGAGTRSTVWGANTVYAHTDGGFASIVCDALHMEVQLIGADAQLLYAGDV